MATPTTISSTTQQFLDIYDITNDILIMKDGATSMILTVDAMNFGLLAEEEQDAIMYSYAGLLNSLNYPVQIVIRSQTKDATNYLNLLKEQENQTTSDLKKSQIRSYREFVSDLIKERNVLDKKFYIVIPATSLEMGLLPPQTVVPGVKQIDISSVDRSVILEKALNILEPKRDHLVAQFGRIGLYARQLQTQEIIQLFYISYNPEAAEGQQITNTSDYTTALVGSQTTMTDTTPVPPTPVPTTPAEPTPTPGPIAPPVTPPMTPTPPAPTTPTEPMAPVTQIPPTPMPAPTATSPVTPSPMAAPTSTQTIEPMTTPAPTAAAPVGPTVVPPMQTAEADAGAQEAQNLINMTAQQVSGTNAPTTPSTNSMPTV